MITNPTKRLVYPDGDTMAKIALIGEAPGQQEERVGKGFVGPSGQLLFNIMAKSIGMTRADCYITNVIKERPRDNDVSEYITFKADKAFPTQRYLDFEKMFYEEIDKVKANVFVAVGGVALYALTRKTGISKQRGSILTDWRTGRKVIPIIHPAAALRNYLFTHTISMDLKRVKEESAYPEVRLPSRHIKINPSYEDSVLFLSSCMSEAQVAFDIEVMRNEVSCVSFAKSPYDVISIPFAYSKGDFYTIEQECSLWRMIANILEDPSITKVGQNIVFDSTFIYRKYGIQTKNVKDTMICQAIMYPDFPKGLDFITAMHTKEPYYKDEGKKHFKIGGSDENFWIYNAKDSAVCLEALPRIEADLQRIDNLDAAIWQTRLVEPLVYLQERGIKIDVKGMEAESKRAGDEISNLTNKLHEITKSTLNPNSPNQLKEYFYKVKGEKPYVNRKTGGETVDKNALKRLARKGHEEAKILLEIRHLSKLKSTYLDVTLDTDNRLRCSFNPVGTESGRLSSSETIFDTGTNMQNLPMEFRKYMIADDDTLLFNIDLSQAENRLVAYIAPEPNMIKAFEEKIDIHSQTGALISGLPIDEVKRQDKEHVFCHLGSQDQTWRFWGKKANHGLNYDLGYRTFSFYYEIPENDGKFICEKYHHAYPGVHQYHAWVRNQLSKDRTLTNIFGRKRLFLDRWDDELFKSAYSFIPQSSIADLLNRKGLIYVYENQDRFRPVDLLLQVHDSIVFQMNYKKHSWEEQAKCLIDIKNSLEADLLWKSTTFSIPISLEIGFNLDKKNMVEVGRDEFASVERLARRLYEVYEQLRASLFV
jgi:uracil-DNA glycosylase family 4